MDTNHDAPVCPDWVFLNNCNVHVAKDRGWFKTYTPFTSSVGSFHFTSSPKIPVLGIGTVEIPTKRSPNQTGVSSHGSLHLKEVLHVPDFICNVIGSSILSDGYHVTIQFDAKKSGTIKDSQGKSMAYFDLSRPLFCIKVRNSPQGPKLGPYVLQKGEMYMLSCRWEPSEKQRWLDYKAGNGRDDSGSTQMTPNPPYTDEEKRFLKANFRNEYHFLLQYGLKIHREDDCAEGRRILRAIIREDEEDSDDEPEDDGSEFDFTGHQADYNFSEEQLEWIEKNYGNSEAFMVSYGLKFYDDDDLEEAKAIVDAMIHDED